MEINRKTVAFIAVSLLILQVLWIPLSFVNANGGSASLTGRIYDRGVDIDHNGKFDYLEVSVEINVTTADEYEVNIYGLTDLRFSINVYDSASAYLGAGIHLLNLSLNGPTIYVSGMHPTHVQYITLYRVGYQFLTKELGWIDSRSQISLTRWYHYNEFDAPFNDMEARLIVDPDGQVHLAGALNYTHMELSSGGFKTRGDAKIKTNGNLTSASANSTFTMPPEVGSEFPYNSTSFSWLEQYLDGEYSMKTNAMVILPVGVASEFPFNVTDASIESLYSNGLLTTEVNASTVLPESIASQFPLNTTDFAIQGQYLDNILNGTISVHILSGFPLVTISIDFQGNKTDLSLTGSVQIIYNIPIFPLNKTTLEQMLLNLNSTIPRQGPSSLYQMTNGTLECSYLYTSMTPYDSIGANVDFNASIHGDFMETIANVLSSYLFGSMSSPKVRELIYSALNATMSSVNSASFQIAYTHSSREISMNLILADEFLNLVKDLTTLVEEIPLSSYPPLGPIFFSESFSSNTTTSPTSSAMMVISSWVLVAMQSVFALNATLPYVKDATIDLTYACVSRTFEIEVTVQAEFPEKMSPQTLPKGVPPEIQELMELLQNTTYCKLKSSEESLIYEDGIADLKVNYVIEGDLTAEINFVKNIVLAYMNKTSPLSGPLAFVNETVIDINNLEINFDYNETYVTGDLEGLTVLPPNDCINATYFQLEKLLNIPKELHIKSPAQRERLKIIVEGGSNITHSVILHRPETVPPPDEVSADLKTMIWYNQSVSNLKDLIFEIRPQSYGMAVTANDQLGNPLPNANVKVYWPNGTLWKTLSTGEYGVTSAFNVDYAYIPFGTYNIMANYSGVLRTQSYTIDHTGIYAVTLLVSSPQIVISITNPANVSSTNPVTGDATQNAAAILTIKQISEPVTIAVRNVTAPTGTPPSGTWKLLGSYVQIIANETTLTVNATLRIYYTVAQLNALGLNESSLKISYWNSTSGQWVSAQSEVNTAGHYVEAVITHFSVWTIMGQPRALPSSQPPIWTQAWFLGTIIGIIILIAAATAYVKYRQKPSHPTTEKSSPPFDN